MNIQNPKSVFSRFGFAHLAGIAATILISILVLEPIVAHGMLQTIADTVGPSFILLITYLPNFGYLLIFWLIVRGLPKTDWQKRPMRFGEIIQAFLMMYAISTVLNGIGLTISQQAPAGGSSQLDLVGTMVSTKTIMGFLIPTVIGPVVEELIFRKLMIDRLHHYGEKTVIIFTALCFGLFHGNLTQFLFATCVGLFLGYVYCRTGKILITMIMHFVLNTLSSVLILVIPIMSADSSVGIILAIAFFVLMAIMIVTGFILIIKHLRAKDVVLDDTMSTAIAKEDVFRTVYMNPGVLLLFIVNIAGIVMDLFKISLPFFNTEDAAPLP